jgi:peptide deformylase
MKLPILTDGDPILRKSSITVPQITEETKKLIADMSETMLSENGVGLAAPQIGRNIRIITILTKDGVQAYINPRITWRSLWKEKGEEGCLSIPGYFDYVRRNKKIKMTALDTNGKELHIKAVGLFARVIQHEIDHLDGILFTDYISK